jgi:hypothetical protein
MARLFLSCPDAARKISQACEEPLPPLDRMLLRLHLLSCRHCARYLRQVRWLHFLFREYPGHLSRELLSESTVEKIVVRLRNVPPLQE